MTSLILTPAAPQAGAIRRCFAAGGQSARFGELTQKGLREYGSDGGLREPSTGPDDYEAIVPTGSLDTSTMLRRDGALRLGQITMDPSSLRWLDKSWSLAFAEQAGVPIPRTWHSAMEIPSNAGRIFYKPWREGQAGARTWVEKVDDIPAHVKANDSGFIFQEKVEGRDVFSFGFLADRGRVVAGVGLAERLSYPPDGGGAVVMELFDDPELAAQATRLIATSDYSGWGLAEFKRCPRRNAYVLMEINPKFWASIELTLRTRPEFARLLFGLTVPSEPLQKMWWPRRMAMLGIDRWPLCLGFIRGASRSQESFPPNYALRAALPLSIQARIGRWARHFRSKGKAPADVSGQSTRS